MTAKNEGVKGLRLGWVGELLLSSFPYLPEECVEEEFCELLRV